LINILLIGRQYQLKYKRQFSFLRTINLSDALNHHLQNSFGSRQLLKRRTENIPFIDKLQTKIRTPSEIT